MKKVIKKSLFVIVGLLSVSLVIAQNFLFDSMREFYGAIGLGPQNSTIVLFGILLFMIIYSVLKRMNLFDEGPTGWIVPTVISLIIVVLIFIGLPPEFIDSILLQYGALGATFLTAIPLLIMIYFTFVVLNSIMIARAVWIIYILYYFSIFVFKISEDGYNTIWEAVKNVNNLPYLVAIIAGIVIFIFTKSFRNLIWKGKLESKEEKGLRELGLAKIGRKLDAQRAEDV